MSSERLYNELKEICNYDLEEMKRILAYLQDRLQDEINNAQEDEMKNIYEEKEEKSW